MKIKSYDITGKPLTAWEINTKILGKVNNELLAQALRVYEWNSHQKTHKVKSRGEVVGSTKKIYRQKGTGRARHGARYAPIFVGGGVAHGPRGERPANLTLSKIMKKGALKSALLLKTESNAIAGLEKVGKADGKTNSAAKLLALIANHPKNKVIVVTAQKTTAFYRGLCNLQGVKTRRADLLNAYDLVAADYVIFTKKGLARLMERIGK